MIVQCDKCETKFRIADEKVTGGGVKVRCSKCAHVFVVRKDSGLGTQASTTVKVAPDALTRIPPMATTKEVAAALGFGSAPPRAPVPSYTTAVDQPRPEGLPIFPAASKKPLPAFPPAAAPSNDRFPESRAISEMKTEQMKLPGSTAKDTFHDFGSSPGISPDPFANEPSASDVFPPFPSAPDPFAHVPSGVTDPFPKVPSGVSTHNPFLSPDPFGAQVFNPSSPDPFADAGAMSQPAVRPDSNPFQNPPAPGPDLLQRGGPKFPPPAFESSPPPQPQLEGLPEPDDHDPFAEIDIRPEPAFEPAPSFPPAPASADRSQGPLGRIQFGNAAVPMTGEVSHAKTAVAAAYRADEDEHEAPGSGAWPTLIGVALGVVIALFVFPGLIGDWMDLRIGTELIRPKKLLPESIDRLSPTGARVTSYEGKNGTRMLVVSGLARNDGDRTIDNVQAVVMMMEGDEILERRRALVGAPLDEATLANVENAADLEAAQRTAKQNATPEQLEIAPGANARFVVVFPGIPEQIETRKFRVEFVEAQLESAKKTEPTP